MDERARTLARLEQLASLLDDRFTLPGTNFRFGLDPILGLIPGIGDSATAALTGYMILVARRHRLPASVQARMVVNLGLDWLVGSIPLLGDLFDFGFKANRRNLTLLRRHLGPFDV
ncbi:DUF4112 domain-containing protein [Marivibrio halodurans]|uniref:DUF4112 domain-containing protein n=2 Tax=Marivibrio halodurans TaxID=2039722 RepID=A0A8J7S4Q2_9PROT|nr:DUF4112 domain-containing protein [Marivibrio halodurans]